MGYNGWKNYETWCVKLWIDNDEGLHNAFRELAEGVVEEITEPAFEWCTAEDTQANELRCRAEELFLELVVDPVLEPMPASVLTDLLNSSLGEVDWREIAESLLEDARDALAHNQS